MKKTLLISLLILTLTACQSEKTASKTPGKISGEKISASAKINKAVAKTAELEEKTSVKLSSRDIGRQVADAEARIAQAEIESKTIKDRMIRQQAVAKNKAKVRRAKARERRSEAKVRRAEAKIANAKKFMGARKVKAEKAGVDKVSVEVVKARTQEAIDTTNLFIAQKEAQYVKQIEDKYVSFKKELERLNKRADVIREESKKKIAGELQALSKKMSSTEAELTNLNKSGDEIVQALSTELEDMLTSVQATGTAKGKRGNLLK